MIPWLVAAATFALHAATAHRYGYFRDELYFIACSKHLAWGFVDQPPLVALAAWLASPAGYDLLALRGLPIAAAAATAYLAARFTRDLGGGRYAQLLAGVTTALAPAYLLLGNTLTTTSLEPLTWTLLAYAVVRLLRGGGNAWWIAIGAIVAFGGYGKYSIALPVIGILTGLLLTRQRALLRSPWPLAAAAVALLLLLPNLSWQAVHGWPFFHVLAGDAAHRPALRNGWVLESANLARNAAGFVAEQILYLNPLALLVWGAGLIAPFATARMRDLRFLTIAYGTLCVVAIALGAKGYYICGCYASLFALGAAAWERAATPLRWAVFSAVAAIGIAAMPLSLPVLNVGSDIAYERLLGLTGRGGAAPHLMQPVFAEEFGWQRLAADVGSVYAGLPAAQRAQAAVYADTYADAAALDFFGPRYGLPPAISTQNSYYLWGTRGYSGAILVAVGASRIDRLRRYYRSVSLVKVSDEPLKWVVEGPSPIYLCRDPVAPLQAIWPKLRWYGA